MALTHVLIVDDEDDIREFISCVIEANFNAAVTHAKSGHEAIRRLKSGLKVDAVVCDFNMPDGNGSIVYAHLLEQGEEAKFVLCSSSPPESIAGFKGKSLPFIQKPFVETTLVQTLSDLLGTTDKGRWRYFRVQLRYF